MANTRTVKTSRGWVGQVQEEEDPDFNWLGVDKDGISHYSVESQMGLCTKEYEFEAQENIDKYLVNDSDRKALTCVD